MRRAIVQDNVATGALTGVAGEDRGFFQLWSKSDKDWEVTFQRNTLTNFVFALRSQLLISVVDWNVCPRERDASAE